MRRHLLFGLALFALSTTVGVHSTSAIHPSADAAPFSPDSLRRIRKVLVSPGLLWLLDLDGILYRLNLSTRRLAQDTGLGRVADLALSSNGDPAALTVRGKQTLILTYRSDWQEAATLPTLPGDTVLALGFLGSRPAVLTTAAVFVELTGGNWRRRALASTTGLGSLQPSVAWATDGSLYVGVNRGEWGGGLWRVSLATGQVMGIVRRTKGKPFTGPLDPDLDPVTAVIRDPTDGRCIVGAVGLLHMGLQSGRVVRVCGDSVSVVFREPCPMPPGTPPAVASICSVAVFGLAEAKNGFWAVTPYGVVRFDQLTVAERHQMPNLDDAGGVLLARDIPGILLIGTDVNWTASVSGLTPLIAVLN